MKDVLKDIKRLYSGTKGKLTPNQKAYKKELLRVYKWIKDKSAKGVNINNDKWQEFLSLIDDPPQKVTKTKLKNLKQNFSSNELYRNSTFRVVNTNTGEYKDIRAWKARTAKQRERLYNEFINAEPEIDLSPETKEKDETETAAEDIPNIVDNTIENVLSDLENLIDVSDVTIDNSIDATISRLADPSQYFDGNTRFRNDVASLILDWIQSNAGINRQELAQLLYYGDIDFSALRAAMLDSKNDANTIFVDYITKLISTAKNKSKVTAEELDNILDNVQISDENGYSVPLSEMDFIESIYE